MQFAVSFPWWMLLMIAAATAAVAWGCYAGAIVALSPRRRAVLTALRALTLLLLVACLLRPVRVVPPDAASDAVVPILVDVSRSMRLTDANGASRLEAARRLVQQQFQPALARRFRIETWGFGDALEQTPPDGMAADDRNSDLSGALKAVRERYRERRVAGLVVISDGGTTGTDAVEASAGGGVPVYTVGVGSPRTAADYEVLDVSAGDMALADSSIDITVAAVSRGKAAPFDLRLLENGRPIDLRSVTPAADGSPVRAVFTVSPGRETATQYTVEIPSAVGELVLENNRRSVLVEPAGPRRQILMVEGAPGFEHSFIKRALAGDPGVEINSVVRKGHDARGASTYFVQAAEARASRLATGFPHDRSALYEYDAVVLANIEADALSRAQLQMVADFVDQRGGGLLMLGAKSFVDRGFGGTPLEPALPLQLTDRGSGVVRVSSRPATQGRLAVTLTGDGQTHPIMRIAGAEEMGKRWAAVPSLAGVATLGALRPGAQALALVQAPDGARPLVAVQRFGRGRSMVFAGEASWRWRMQLPSDDRTHELFWRQAVRWVAAGAPDPVSIAPLAGMSPGTGAAIAIDVRGEDFAPLTDAGVQLRITRPDGAVDEIPGTLVDPQSGRYSADYRFPDAGVYQMSAAATRGGEVLGRAVRAILVGGADLEMADPRLNEDVLRRVALASGGGYIPAADASGLPSLLTTAAAEASTPQLEELWHNLWLFIVVMMLLGAEWMLRRRWGLR